MRDIYQEFHDYDFEPLSKIVKNILEENCICNFYTPPSIANLSFSEKEQLQKAIQDEKQQKQQDRTLEEERYVSYLQEQEGGAREVPIFDPELKCLVGLADLVTHKEVIEVKNVRNWKHAVGQVFTYWDYLSLNKSKEDNNLIPRIHLFSSDGINDKRIKLCQSLMKKVFYPYINSVKVTYPEEDDYIFDED